MVLLVFCNGMLDGWLLLSKEVSPGHGVTIVSELMPVQQPVVKGLSLGGAGRHTHQKRECGWCDVNIATTSCSCEKSPMWCTLRGVTDRCSWGLHMQNLHPCRAAAGCRRVPIL